MYALIVIVLAAILMTSGCASLGPWEDARLECLQYANAACISAMMDGYPAGIVSCTLPGTSVRHAVIWILKDGKQLFYDPSWGCYRSQKELGKVHGVTYGPSKGAFDVLPMPVTDFDFEGFRK